MFLVFHSLAPKALFVNYLRTVLIIILLGDPEAGEGREGSKGRTTSPDGESSVGAGNNLNADGLVGSGLDLLKESLSNTLVHSVTTREDNVLVEISSEFNIALLD